MNPKDETDQVSQRFHQYLEKIWRIFDEVRFLLSVSDFATIPTHQVANHS